MTIISSRLLPFLSRMLCGAVLLTLITMTSRTFGAIQVYEPFDYPAGTLVAESNHLAGGFGWSTDWQDQTPGGFGNGPGLSSIEANSLSYTDAVGQVLVTAGNKILNTGTMGGGTGTTSRPWRSLTNLFSAAGTTNWISFLGVR